MGELSAQRPFRSLGNSLKILKRSEKCAISEIAPAPSTTRFIYISLQKRVFLHRRDLRITGANFLSGNLVHHELHPERSEGSGGIETSAILSVNLAQTDVSLRSTWIRSVVQKSPAGICVSGAIDATAWATNACAPPVLSHKGMRLVDAEIFCVDLT
jgi:hypothetical protein